MSITLSTVIGVGALVGVLAYAFCVVPSGEQTPARDDYDPSLADLGPDHGEGLTWDARWDEEPRPGTGPRRDREVL